MLVHVWLNVVPSGSLSWKVKKMYRVLFGWKILFLVYVASFKSSFFLLGIWWIFKSNHLLGMHFQIKECVGNWKQDALLVCSFSKKWLYWDFWWILNYCISINCRSIFKKHECLVVENVFLFLLRSSSTLYCVTRKCFGASTDTHTYTGIHRIDLS